MKKKKMAHLMLSLFVIALVFSSLTIGGCRKEHGGAEIKEHAGSETQEHAGAAVKEHGGTTTKEHGGN